MDEGALRRVFARYADDLVGGDYEVGDVLDRLSDQCVEVLRVAGAGVSLRDGEDRLSFVTATDARASRVEAQQVEGGTGPCYTAFRTGRLVVVSDLEQDDRWPAYRAVGLEVGYRSVVGVPMPVERDTVGAFDIYDTDPRDWTESELEAARLLSNMATGYILAARSLADARRLSDQLQHALDSRIVIEQAKGVVVARQGVDPGRAFELLRAHARATNRRVHDVARDVLEGGPDLRLPT